MFINMHLAIKKKKERRKKKGKGLWWRESIGGDERGENVVRGYGRVGYREVD